LREPGLGRKVIAPEAPAARLIAASNPADQRTWTMDDLDLLRAASLGPAVIDMNHVNHTNPNAALCKDYADSSQPARP
jgi:hypothetical protein